jgi:hypothetical protein
MHRLVAAVRFAHDTKNMSAGKWSEAEFAK